MRTLPLRHTTPRPTWARGPFIFLGLPLLLLGACGKSHIQSMVELDSALASAEEAAKEDQVEGMRAQLDVMLALLEQPSVVGHIDQQPYPQMRLQVQRLIQEIRALESAAAAAGRFAGLRQACDACHHLYAAPIYDQ